MWGLLSFLFLGGTVAKEKMDQANYRIVEAERKKAIKPEAKKEYNYNHLMETQLRDSTKHYLVGKRVAKEVGIKYDCLCTAINIQEDGKKILLFNCADVASQILTELRLQKEGYDIMKPFTEFEFPDPIKQSKEIENIQIRYFFGSLPSFHKMWEEYKNHPTKIMGALEYRCVEDMVINGFTPIGLSDNYDEMLELALADEDLFMREEHIRREYPMDFDMHTRMLKWQHGKMQVKQYLDYAHDILENATPYPENEAAPQILLYPKEHYIEGVKEMVCPLTFEDWEIVNSKLEKDI